MEQLYKRYFYSNFHDFYFFWKFNLDLLFVVHFGAFWARGAPSRQLRANLIKHKVWGSFFGARNAKKWFQGPKKAPSDLMFYKVFAKLATLRNPKVLQLLIWSSYINVILTEIFKKLQFWKINLEQL